MKGFIDLIAKHALLSLGIMSSICCLHDKFKIDWMIDWFIELPSNPNTFVDIGTVKGESLAQRSQVRHQTDNIN